MSEIPSAEKDVLDRHEFGEATGGYTMCMCGWPTREQWEAGESPVEHVIAELVDAGVLTRVLPPAETKADYLLDGSPEAVAIVREARGLPPLDTRPLPLGGSDA